MRLPVAVLAIAALLLAGCGATKASVSVSPSAAATSAFAGYWRSDNGGAAAVELLRIRRAGDRFALDMCSLPRPAPLRIEGDRLVYHEFWKNKELWRYVLSMKQGGDGLALSILQGPDFQAKQDITATFTRASGSDAELATEMRSWAANVTIAGQVSALSNAVSVWANKRGRFPPRQALLPGGAFWKWHRAPRLTNAITGGPMILGGGPGNFDYTTNGGDNYSISGHLYGGAESTQSGG